MKHKYLLLGMALFIFLLLFFATSLALIPGDFGSAGGGPPDGVVDFEDLMIFAMAYGSTPADSNWNPLCDIAGPSGSITPDGVIDFEDLMIFAMHYGDSYPVHNITKGIYYDTIQVAIDNADSGDIIEISDGTYTENVNINKDHLIVKSENGVNSTIVQAENSDYHVFEVTANYVNISGLTINGTIYPASGIYLNTASYCDLQGNNISNNNLPILLENSSSNTIASNKVFENEAGISLFYSNNNMVTSNEVFLNEGACGLYLFESNSNIIEGNNLLENSYGIDIDFSSNNNIVNNSISNNWCAVSLDLGTNSNVLSNNVISSNHYAITTADSADNNEIYSNNFINNSETSYDYYGTNIWHSPEEITYTYNSTTYTNYLGNYWSDYTGSDTDGDGIGDTPYIVDGEQDNYPLVEPFENYF